MAEKWDFKLDFNDWKTTSLLNAEQKDQKKQINPQLEILLDDRHCIKKCVKSKTLVNQYFPYWDEISDGMILFRGTYGELRMKELLVTVIDKSSILDTQIGQKLIPMKDILEKGFIKTEMIIWRDHKHKEDDLNHVTNSCLI